MQNEALRWIINPPVPRADGTETTSTRKRILENWSLDKFQAKDSTDVWYLVGQVTMENVGGEEIAPPARFTKTSPIKSCDGNKITTASGSIYYLGTPAPETLALFATMGFSTTSNNAIPQSCINQWIEGDNWMTY